MPPPWTPWRRAGCAFCAPRSCGWTGVCPSSCTEAAIAAPSSSHSCNPWRSSPMPKTEIHPSAAARAYEARALVLQGGGALGAYQAGVYEGLNEAGIELTDLAGISIGALNAAIIAGNPAERRVERLHAFWNTICQPYIGPAANPMVEHSLFQINDLARQFLGAVHAGSALMVGQKGFFRPRFPPAALAAALDPASVGHYDTRPLKDTLESLCDFDRINDSGLHVSVGAVNVRTGNFVYFDNRRTRLQP